MATVLIQAHKLKNSMSYCVIYRDPLTGKKKHYKAYRKKREASQAANDLRALLDSGDAPKPKQSRISPLTFSEVGQSLKAEWQSRLDTKDLRQKTFDEYVIWLNVLSRTFGKLILCSITKDDLVEHVTSLASQKSNITANRNLSVLKMVFHHGVKLKAIKTDISKEIKMFSEKSHIRNRFLLPNQLDSLIDSSQDNRGKFYMPAAIYLGAEHGASKQEILSLRWSDIDFDFKDGLGLIRFFRTKNTRERTEILMPRTREALLKWKEHIDWKRHRTNYPEEEIKSDHVFCRIDGSPIKRFDKSWQSCKRNAGITNFHFHDLRHTFCSNLILSGSGLKDAKDMIGHSDISMTDRYSHLTNSHKFNSQQRLADYYSSAQQ